eukprot:SAG25_NODE_2785_length_1384_cov_1.874708_1_plen_174_part_00
MSCADACVGAQARFIRSPPQLRRLSLSLSPRYQSPLSQHRAFQLTQSSSAVSALAPLPRSTWGWYRGCCWRLCKTRGCWESHLAASWGASKLAHGRCVSHFVWWRVGPFVFLQSKRPRHSVPPRVIATRSAAAAAAATAATTFHRRLWQQQQQQQRRLRARTGPAARTGAAHN